MRRPIDVKAHFHFLSFFLRESLFPSQPSRLCRHPSIRTVFVSDICSVQGGCARFSRCCYLIIDLSSHRFGESRAPGLSRSHLDWAVGLGCPDRNSKPLPASLSDYCAMVSCTPLRLPTTVEEQYRQLSSHGNHRSFLGIFSTIAAASF